MADNFQKKLNAFAIIFVGVTLISAVAMIMTTDLDDFKIHYGQISSDQATEFFQSSNNLTQNSQFKSHLQSLQRQHKNKSFKKDNFVTVKDKYPTLKADISDLKSFAVDEQKFNTYMNELWNLLSVNEVVSGKQVIKQDLFINKLKEFGLNDLDIQSVRKVFEFGDMNHSGFIGKAEWNNFSELLRDSILDQYSLIKDEDKHSYKLLIQDESEEEPAYQYKYYIHPSPL